MAHPKNLNIPFSETKHPQPPAPTLCLCAVCACGFFGKAGRHICSECRFKLTHAVPLPDSLSLAELRRIREALAKDMTAENQVIEVVEKITAQRARAARLAVFA